MRGKKALKNTIALMIKQLTTIVCGFIVSRIIIVNYGSDTNGVISSITQFLAYISLLEVGIGPVIKAALYKPIARKNKKEIEGILRSSEKFFRKISLIFIIYMIVLCIVLPNIIHSDFTNMYIVSLVIILSIATFMEYFFGITYTLYLQAEQRTYISSYIQVFTTVLNAIAVIILASTNVNIQLLKLVSAIVLIFRPILQNIYVHKKFNINLKDGDKEYRIPQKWYGMAQHIASIVHNNVGTVVITLFCHISEVSVYSVYIYIISGIKNFIQSFSSGVEASFGNMIANNEKDNLNIKFRAYEFLYFTIVTIVFTCTIILILPFISIYTRGVNDANYYRPIFAYIIVFGEYIYTLRLPYSMLSFVSGKFKENQKWDWLEAIISLIISLSLVWKLGIVGVAIGILVSMIFRSTLYIIYASRKILFRKIYIGISKFIIGIVQIIVISLLLRNITSLQMQSYFTWILYGIIVALVSVIIIILSNSIINIRDLKETVKIIRNMLKKEKK